MVIDDPDVADSTAGPIPAGRGVTRVRGSDLPDRFGLALVVHGYLVAGHRRLGALHVELAAAEVAEGR